MNGVFNGLANHYSNTSLPLPAFAPSSWVLLLQNFCPVFQYILKGSSTVTYPCFINFLLLVAKEVQLFLGQGVYSGIFAIYLKCPSNESRTRMANIVFYTICLLYAFCSATIVIDLLYFILGVSNKFICKNIIFTISRTVAFQYTIDSTSNWHIVNIKSHCGRPRNITCLWWLHFPVHHSTHKQFQAVCIIHFIYLNL